MCEALAIALLGVAVLALNLGAPRAQDDKTAEEVFRDHISGPIIQSRCINCHVAGGLSGNTRLVFVRSSDTLDHEARNLRTLQNLLDDLQDEGGGNYILNKIQGVAHGGGVQVPLGSAHFASMERFLGLLGEQVARGRLTPETLFDTVIMASPRKTLRRAALIFAGRLPTEAEYAAVEGGNATALRATVRGLMTGPQFHEFLLRASNDRLLTDRQDAEILSRFRHLVDFVNESYRRAAAAGGAFLNRDYSDWYDAVQYGARRAPLELIAHVVQNDLPYTEILTADYIMANPWTARAYGASTRFDDPDDVHEFRPSRILNYYRMGDGFEAENDPVLQVGRILDPGPLHTDYPHAGILNTNAFLKRYPTTATNRNRARARWTYYHFLGLDVEKSASRTTDPVALADTNNPTMHNPACTVCHSVLDPVAGAFQNYGDEGYYKDKWGGLDSLDEFYKEGDLSLAIEAESWAQRETLVWPVSLAAGVETLRVTYTNHFWDDVAQEGGRVYMDRLRVIDDAGQVVAGKEFENLAAPVAHWGNCGQARSSGGGRNDHFELWGGYLECAFYIDVDVPSTGAYDVEVVAWSTGRDERYNGDSDFAELSVVANGYEEGDTWYRDMRTPGFNGKQAPNPDNSVQWLARQIVADPRFAEATVKFWWPAIMGSEVATPPAEEGDADFEGRLLAATAQGDEVTRLANGFRRGFPRSRYTYNLKDLLVEIVMSEWFRADAVTDMDPIRRAALHDAGARRLLTPEELARKTAAITGFQWGRRTDAWPYENRWPSALTGDYRLLYGGIDSDGVAERGRDVTSVMAGVAKRYAVQVSCPVVLRELYLLPDTERWLFAGINPSVTDPNAIKGKLVELHDKLLGVQVGPDSPEVAAAYQLFAGVAARGRQAGKDWFEWWRCNINEDHFSLDGILDGALVTRVNEDGYRWHDFDWERVNAFMDDTDLSDPHATAQAWVVVLTAMLMDHRYLYLN